MPQTAYKVRQNLAWKVEGDYFEGCNCNSTCPCIFLGDPDEGDCKLAIAWHIENGQYESVKLDGLNVVGIFHTPANMVKGPKWSAALYLDERASTDQADALSKIFSGQAGGFLATVATFIDKVMGVKKAVIKFEKDGKKRRMHIPNVLDIEIGAIAGGDPNKESTITNPTLYAAPGFDPVISQSTKYVYHDHGLEWDNSGKNAFYSHFSYGP